MMMINGLVLSKSKFRRKLCDLFINVIEFLSSYGKCFKNIIGVEFDVDIITLCIWTFRNPFLFFYF